MSLSFSRSTGDNIVRLRMIITVIEGWILLFYYMTAADEFLVLSLVVSWWIVGKVEVVNFSCEEKIIWVREIVLKSVRSFLSSSVLRGNPLIEWLALQNFLSRSWLRKLSKWSSSDKADGLVLKEGKVMGEQVFTRLLTECSGS